MDIDAVNRIEIKYEKKNLRASWISKNILQISASRVLRKLHYSNGILEYSLHVYRSLQDGHDSKVHSQNDELLLLAGIQFGNVPEAHSLEK